ncbi:sensor histidine kinase [Pseudofulvimonas gallinarii]|uniref:Two-component system sensor histidine kinase DesK n=1 Tax=Pseudofulvimonas gallinarii TaxID=634155 RepID=A0A4R3LKA4_9GAMM|nr:sensor histidine kinase [Pseudofulvimonas gallinarii]TCT00673.1 two-component system sensor histidine kinase DesK [Pseudofulvimonas gallinarii]
MALNLRTLKTLALRWRDRLVPPSSGLGWAPILWLGYLSFTLLPMFAGWLGPAGVAATWLSMAPFLVVYFLAFRQSGLRLLLAVLAIAGIGFALTPFNPFGNAYLIYAAGFLPGLTRTLPRAIAMLLLLVGLYALQTWWLGGHWLSPAIALLVGTSSCVGNYYMMQKMRKDAELRLSVDEVRRLAQVAERERIGRDLHDLLGHTLSLVALKSELARRLVERDPLAAQVEIGEVERVAREALAQVRRAVTGIRAAALKPELASARLLLDGAGVGLTYSLTGLELMPAQETALALAVREAVTNIHRHARARAVEISLRCEDGVALLTVVDDGCGGAGEPGNGLRGMAERIEALGGSLAVHSPRGEGTRIVVRLPLPPSDEEVGGNVTPLRRSAA